MTAVRPTENNENVQVTTKALVQTRRHVRQFNLAGIKKATSAISGLHDSRFRGRGMDYQESRAYQAGDDIRNMDWRVTARTGDAHTKLFQEERERPVYLLVDTNPNMHFATRRQFKSVIAAQVASTLGWAAVQQGDRIGVMTYGDGIDILKAKAGKKGMMTLIQQLVKANQTGPVQGGPNQINPIETALDAALKQLRSVLRPGSLVIIVSDFMRLGSRCKKHLVQLRKHNDILAVHVSDPFEQQLPPAALFGLYQNGQHKVLNTRNAKVRGRIDQQLKNQRQQIRQNILHAGVPILPISTAEDWLQQLKQGISNPQQAGQKWLRKSV